MSAAPSAQARASQPVFRTERAAAKPVGRTDRIDVLIACGISAAMLAVYLWMTRQWDAHHVFNQYDILLDTDPNMRLQQLAHGWSSDGIVHPVLNLLFSIPIRVVTAIMGAMQMIADPVLVRRSMGLWITPALTALKIALTYVTARVLGGSRSASAALMIVAGTSVAGVVFGAIPDHPAISSAILTGLFGWAVAVRFGAVRDRWPVWLILTALAAGITITNVVPAAILYFMHRLYGVTAADRREAVLKAAASTGILATIAVAGVVTIHVVSTKIVPSDTSVSKTTDWTHRYVRRPSAEVVTRYVVAIANSIAAPAPETIPNQLAQMRLAMGIHNIDVQFTYDTLPLTFATWARTLGLLGIAGIGAWIGWRGDARMRSLIVAALAIIAWNGMLHMVWGTEWMLYSLHWHAALMILFAGYVFKGRLGTAVLFALGMLAASSSGIVVRHMLAVLESASS